MKSNATYIDFLNGAVCSGKAHPSFSSFCSDDIFRQPNEGIHWISELNFTYVMQRGSVEGRKNRKHINIKSFFGIIKVFRVEIFLLSFVSYFVFIRGQLVCFCVFLELSSLSCRASCVLCILSSVFWQFGSFLSFVLSGPAVILSLESCVLSLASG